MSKQELLPEFAHLEPLMRTLPEEEEKNWEEFIKDEFNKGEQILADPSFSPELRRRMTDFIGSLHYIDTMLSIDTRNFPASRAKLGHQVFERVTALKEISMGRIGEGHVAGAQEPRTPLSEGWVENVAKRRGVTVEEIYEGAVKFCEGRGNIYAKPEYALFIYCLIFGAGGDPLKE